jgi:hypothetical protein
MLQQNICPARARPAGVNAVVRMRQNKPQSGFAVVVKDFDIVRFFTGNLFIYFK